MMKRSALRVLVGTTMGIAGGASLIMTVFPYGTAWILERSSFDLAGFFGSSALAVILLWAVAGGLVGWYGGALTGTLAMGICGAIAGFMLAAFAAKGNMQLIMVGTMVGLIYGGFGGLIIGLAFPKSITELE